MKALIHHGHIGVACAVVVMIVSLLLFHDNEDAMTGGTVVALIVCFGVFSYLNRRDERTRAPRKTDAG